MFQKRCLLGAIRHPRAVDVLRPLPEKAAPLFLLRSVNNVSRGDFLTPGAPAPGGWRSRAHFTPARIARRSAWSGRALWVFQAPRRSLCIALPLPARGGRGGRAAALSDRLRRPEKNGGPRPPSLRWECAARGECKCVVEAFQRDFGRQRNQRKLGWWEADVHSYVCTCVYTG